MTKTARIVRLVVCCLASQTGMTWAQTPVGSATPPGAAGQQNFEQKVHTFSTVGQGAVVGGIAGGIIGIFVGGKKGAAIGAGLGAGLGAGAGALIGQKQKKYASQEDQLKQMSAAAQKQNDELADLVDSARVLLASDRSKVQQLQSQMLYARNDASVASNSLKSQETQKLRHDLELYDKAIAESDKRLQGSRNALAQYRAKYPQDQDSPELAAVTTSIESFEAKRVELQSVRDEHATLLASIDTPASAR
jgi:hypothetical protein